jgi:hypothetical protein
MYCVWRYIQKGGSRMREKDVIIFVLGSSSEVDACQRNE